MPPGGRSAKAKWMTTGIAGGSAQARADEIASRAPGSKDPAGAAKDAELWARGADGERTTAGILSLLGPPWVLFHDLGIPGRDANLDHLVVGPGGAFLIDSKVRQGLGVEREGTLWFGRHSFRKKTATLRWEVAEIALHLEVDVQPIISLVGARLQTGWAEVDDVPVVPVDRLLWFLRTRPEVLGSVAIEQLVTQFGALPGAHRPSRPGPPSPPALERQDTRRRPRRAHRRGLRRQRRRAGRPLVGALVRLGMVAFGLIALWAMVGALMPTLGDLGTATSARDPLAVEAEFVCPARARGWSALALWPGERPDLRAYLMSWRTVETDQWSPMFLWEQGRSRPVIGEGLGSGAPVWVKAATLLDDGTAGTPAVTRVRAPLAVC